MCASHSESVLLISTTSAVFNKCRAVGFPPVKAPEVHHHEDVLKVADSEVVTKKTMAISTRTLYTTLFALYAQM